MNWPKEYLAAIHSGDEVVSHKVKTVYEREVLWMDNPPKDFPFYFDEKAGQRPIDFIERFCKHSKGEWGKQPVRLELFQKAKIQLAFGWKEKETGYRRFRDVVDIRGRKTGKSTETAGVELYMLIADGEDGAECYCVANKKDQAALVFNEAVNMRQQSEAIRSITTKRQSDIYYSNAFSFMKALAADTSTMDGLNAHFFSQDEPHEAKNRKVYDVMKQSQSARRQPMAWTISTNGFVRGLYFDDLYAYCSHVALWDKGFEDYRTLALIYELNKREYWKIPKHWPEANPGLGTIKNYQALKENVERAKRDPTFLATVLTKDFNVFENSSTQWLTYEDAVNEKTVDLSYLKRSYAIGGCDLSSTTDLTCATLLIRKPNDENFYVLQRYFIPESKVKDIDTTNKLEVNYKLYENEWLTICDGASVDYHQVTEWFNKMVNEYNIRPLWVCYDRALAGYWQEEMIDNRYDMEKIAQGPITWTYPMKRLGGLFEEHKIIYQNNPLLRWCLLNTGKKSINEDGIESIKPVKTGDTKRIDGMVSLLNAFTGYCNHEEEYTRFIR